MTKAHHTAIVVADVEASLRFYREGLGLEVTMDHEFEGDWPELFGARSRRLRSIFLGDERDASGGIVELVVFDGGAEQARSATAPAYGFFLISLMVDVDATLIRLGVEPVGRITLPGPNGPVTMATVRDPDGVLVELIDASA
jgi:catechol 2,3-dioxygenase-like lactoylglutathione lyase family enzyme